MRQIPNLEAPVWGRVVMLLQVSLKSVTCTVGAVLHLTIFLHIFLCFDMLSEQGIGGHGNTQQNAVVASKQKTESGSYNCPVDAFFFKPTWLCVKLHYK